MIKNILPSTCMAIFAGFVATMAFDGCSQHAFGQSTQSVDEQPVGPPSAQQVNSGPVPRVVQGGPGHPITIRVEHRLAGVAEQHRCAIRNGEFVRIGPDEFGGWCPGK